MKVYISQLVETEKIVKLLKKYDVGLEIVIFASPYCLDNEEAFLQEYRDVLGDFMEEIDIGIHGPFVELCPGTRDNLIAQVSKHRMQQGYEIAKKFDAKYVVYHNGYYPRTYSYIEWMQNAPRYWNDFKAGKEEDDIKIHIENVFEEDYFILNELMEEISDDKTGVCLDIGHCNAYSKTDVREWLKILKKYLSHMHIHNNLGDRDSHLGINKGEMDVIEILDMVKDMDITISLEINDLGDLEESLEILYKNGLVKLR